MRVGTRGGINVKVQRGQCALRTTQRRALPRRLILDVFVALDERLDSEADRIVEGVHGVCFVNFRSQLRNVHDGLGARRGNLAVAILDAQTEGIGSPLAE